MMCRSYIKQLFGIKEILAVAVILFAYIQVISEAKISVRIRSENTYHLYRSYMAVLSVGARILRCFERIRGKWATSEMGDVCKQL